MFMGIVSVFEKCFEFFFRVVRVAFFACRLNTTACVVQQLARLVLFTGIGFEFVRLRCGNVGSALES